MTKKKPVDYSEIDIILQANAIVMKEVNEIAQQLIAKYDGGMNINVAQQAAKEYYMLGVVPMMIDPELKKKAEAEVKKYHKERNARIEKSNQARN